MGHETELCNHLGRTPEERLLLRRVLDQSVGAVRKCEPCRTPFLTPRECALAKQLIAALGHPSHRFEGGYPEAERQVCVFLPDWLEPEDELPEPYGLAALRAVWYEGDTLGHRDILGALMGLGIRRETVGDLLVSEHSCDILLLPEILPYLRENFTQAGRVKLKLSEIPLSELSVPPIAKKIIHGTVSSLRLDAVAATGFGTSRSHLQRPGVPEPSGMHPRRPGGSRGGCAGLPGHGKMPVGGGGWTEPKGAGVHHRGALYLTSSNLFYKGVAKDMPVTQAQIDRINQLARKSKAEGLTAEEKEEQAKLRRLYIDAMKESLRGQLDNTYIVDVHGNKRKLPKKKRPPEV